MNRVWANVIREQIIYGVIGDYPSEVSAIVVYDDSEGRSTVGVAVANAGGRTS